MRYLWRIPQRSWQKVVRFLQNGHRGAGSDCEAGEGGVRADVGGGPNGIRHRPTWPIPCSDQMFGTVRIQGFRYRRARPSSKCGSGQVPSSPRPHRRGFENRVPTKCSFANLMLSPIQTPKCNPALTGGACCQINDVRACMSREGLEPGWHGQYRLTINFTATPRLPNTANWHRPSRPCPACEGGVVGQIARIWPGDN